jgi:hypothetical protein
LSLLHSSATDRDDSDSLGTICNDRRPEHFIDPANGEPPHFWRTPSDTKYQMSVEPESLSANEIHAMLCAVEFALKMIELEIDAFVV